MTRPPAGTLTHYAACAAVGDLMVATQQQAADAHTGHDHQLQRALNAALANLAVAHSVAHQHHCLKNGTT